MTFWALVIALVLLPLAALATEVGRRPFDMSEVAKVAGAAAPAAAIEMDRPVFNDTGQMVVAGQAWAEARTFASWNRRTSRLRRSTQW